VERCVLGFTAGLTRECLAVEFFAIPDWFFFYEHRLHWIHFHLCLVEHPHLCPTRLIQPLLRRLLATLLVQLREVLLSKCTATLLLVNSYGDALNITSSIDRFRHEFRRWGG
jgi:hypothetical protein